MHSSTPHPFICKQEMESLSNQAKLFTILILFLSVSSCLQSSQATTPSGTIERTTKQHILASIPPHSQENSQLFLTSPSGKYSAYFLRRVTAPGAGGFGNDFCYVQVQDASTEQSLWESECAPVSEANACALVFDDSGLEVFDGSNPVWDTGAKSADDNPLETLELVDEGDMRIRDSIGELAWKASDDPRANQGCGLPGSPGLAPALPPFAEPIGGQQNQPFGQQQQQQPQAQAQPIGLSNQQQQPLGAGVSQSFGFDSQPLVDNTPYDSGNLRGVESWIGMAWALLLGLFAYSLLF